MIFKRSAGLRGSCFRGPAIQTLVLILALQMGGLASASAAAGGVSARWTKQVRSRATLLSAGDPVAGGYQLGFDIELAPGVLTYWRTPGDAGVPPIFSFSGSRNVASVSVAYPAPSRILEAGSTTYGYMGEVLYPLTVRPKDHSKPSVLNLDLHYATCDTICVPAEARESIRLAPDDAPTGERARIERWTARVPKPLPAPLTPRVKALSGGAKAVWRVTFPAPSGGKADLFVEGPSGWYFHSKPAGAGRFEISLAEKPSGQQLPVAPVQLTLVDGARAYETSISLDAAPMER